MPPHARTFWEIHTSKVMAAIALVGMSIPLIDRAFWTSSAFAVINMKISQHDDSLVRLEKKLDTISVDINEIKIDIARMKK